LKSPGIEIRPIFTFQDERTNTIFYDKVRVPDRYRLGQVNGGLQVMTVALELEQGGGSYIMPHRKVLAAAIAWARGTVRGGRRVIDEPMVLTRLARVATRVEVADILFRRSLWANAQRLNSQTYGPMSKLFATESFLSDSTDLLDLAAPKSLLRGGRSAGYIEQCHRHATATTVYSGTSEIHRSLIAEKTLGLPRSRN
jgi:3-oxochol-4-en-24-oyl-CoA dehydrogenase